MQPICLLPPTEPCIVIVYNNAEPCTFQLMYNVMQFFGFIYPIPLPYEYCIRLTGDPVIVFAYGPAAAWLDTEPVPFSTKGVNHLVYPAHVATDVRCALLFV